MSTGPATDSTTATSKPGPLAPGGPLRRVVVRVLPPRAKAALKKRLTGTRYVRPAVPTEPPPRRLVVSLPDVRTFTLTAPRHLWVPRVLETKGLAQYEPYALDCFLALVESAPEGAVLDIGANVGLYGLLAAAHSDRTVHAFEPAPETAAVARETAAANGLALTVEEIALSDSSGTATLYLSDSTDSSNSLNPDFREHSKEIVVPLETLDAYVARTGIVPAVIKVDTETTEPEVLAGARKVIAEHRPWILCEVLWTHVEDRLHAVMDEFDYHYYHLDGPGPRAEVQRMVGDATWTYFMFLLAPEPVGENLWQRMNAWRTRMAGTAVTPAHAS